MAARRAVVVVKHFPEAGPLRQIRMAGAIAKGLRDRGWSVEFIDTEAADDQAAYRWETSDLPSGFQLTRVRPGNVVSPRQAVWRALEDRGPFDLVVTSQLGHFGQPAIMAARQWQAPVWAHVSGLDVLADIYDPFWAPFVTWSLQAADRVTTSTEEMAALAAPFRPSGSVEVWDEPLPTVEPAAVGSRTEVERRWSLAPTSQRVGLLQASEDGGDLATALAAFALFRESYPDARAILIGPMPIAVQRSLDTWLRVDPANGSRLQVLPHVDDPDLAEILAACDQLWLPVRQLTSRFALWHGLSLGVPMVVADLSGIGDSVADETHVLRYACGDAHALAVAAGRFAADEAWARSVGMTGREVVPEAVAQAGFEDRLDKALAHHGLA